MTLPFFLMKILHFEVIQRVVWFDVFNVMNVCFFLEPCYDVNRILR